MLAAAVPAPTPAAETDADRASAPPAVRSGPPPQNWVWHSLRALSKATVAPFLNYRAAGLGHLDPHRGGLVVANHQSFFDAVLLSLPLDRSLTLLARDTLFPLPVVGSLLRGLGSIPLSRDSAGTASMRQILDQMGRGYLCGLFPEGTRTPDGTIRDLKPGFVTLIRRSDVPVYPVGIAGAFESWPRSAKFPRPGRVRVVFGEPFRPAGGRDAVLGETRARMGAAFADAVRWRETGERPIEPGA